MRMRKDPFQWAMLGLALLMLMTSCGMSPYEPRLAESRLIGRWRSEVAYTSSDALYDYGIDTELRIDEEGKCVILRTPYIKNRTGNEWTRNMARNQTQAEVRVWEYPNGESTGRLEFLDADTYRTVWEGHYAILRNGTAMMLNTTADDLTVFTKI